jgi:hypothetical protein
MTKGFKNRFAKEGGRISADASKLTAYVPNSALQRTSWVSLGEQCSLTSRAGEAYWWSRRVIFGGRWVTQSSKRPVGVPADWTPSDVVELDAAMEAIWSYMGMYSAEFATLLKQPEQDLVRLNQILKIDRSAREDARALLEFNRDTVARMADKYRTAIAQAQDARSARSK